MPADGPRYLGEEGAEPGCLAGSGRARFAEAAAFGTEQGGLGVHLVRVVASLSVDRRLDEHCTVGRAVGGVGAGCHELVEVFPGHGAACRLGDQLAPVPGCRLQRDR